MEKVYLDWAATAKPNVSENRKALEIAHDFFANPSSRHSLGQGAHSILETAREKIAQCLSVQAKNIFFTSGGTESNHIALLANILKPHFSDQNIVVSAIEHAAIREQVEVLSHLGIQVKTVFPDAQGLILPEAVLELIDEKTSFVSVMAVNNEVGSIQPIADIVQAIRLKAKRKIHIHTDAVQAIGKLSLALADIDSFSVSAHKLGAMRGIGIIYLKQPITVFNRGGRQEQGIRPGTENLAGALSLQYAMEKYFQGIHANYEKAYIQAETLMSNILSIPTAHIIPDKRVGSSQNFSPYIIQAAFDRIPGEVMVRTLSDRGIAISTGSACSSGKLNRPVLDAMKVPKNIQQSAFRLSLGYTTSDTELEQCIEAIKEVVRLFG